MLYIGQTKRSFIQKIRELNKEWTFDESELKITLGIIEFPSGEIYSEKKVKEIKSLLILRHTPLENETSLLYYRGKFNLKIINKGRRGLIVKKAFYRKSNVDVIESPLNKIEGFLSAEAYQF